MVEKTSINDRFVSHKHECFIETDSFGFLQSMTPPLQRLIRMCTVDNLDC